MVPNGDSSMTIPFRLLCKTLVVSNAPTKE
jgi:hypothetical protein